MLLTVEKLLFVNEKFGTLIQKGHETDRGRIYLEYGDIQIAYKPHPRTSKLTLDIIESSFSKKIIVTPKDILSEFLIANEKVKYVGSYISSSLLYTNIINSNTKPIYFDINKIKPSNLGPGG